MSEYLLWKKSYRRSEQTKMYCTALNRVFSLLELTVAQAFLMGSVQQLNCSVLNTCQGLMSDALKVSF